MDLHLKQWRHQLHESEAEQNPSAPKMPKLHLHLDHHHNPSSALPLFVPEPKITSSTNLSAYPDAATALTKIPRTGSYFSLAQWQELELQALIFRYMMAGAVVPPQLLHPIKNSLLYSSPYFLNHFQPALLQSGYWGRLAMDPEPGRCRRTDGKKWRCSRDVVGGYKYCERHMHRGRNRSRKPVEIPTHTNTASSAATVGAGTPIAASPQTELAGGNRFAVSGSSASIDLLHLSQSSSSHSKHVNKNLFETQNEVAGDDRSDGHVLRHFFDDWPRTLRETDGAGSNTSHTNSATSLSISMPGNSSSDVSLKLSTGVGDEPGSGNGDGERGPRQRNWGSGWSSSHVTSMGGGGPLAEALRSSTSTSSSPTSVLHQVPPISASDTGYVSSLRD